MFLRGASPLKKGMCPRARKICGGTRRSVQKSRHFFYLPPPPPPSSSFLLLPSVVAGVEWPSRSRLRCLPAKGGGKKPDGQWRWPIYLLLFSSLVCVFFVKNFATFSFSSALQLGRKKEKEGGTGLTKDSPWSK